MIRLTRVELRRLLARKVVWLVLLGALAAVIAVLAGVHQQSREVSRALAGELVWFNEMVQDWELNGQEQIRSCLEGQEEERLATGDDSIDWFCEEMGPPTIEDYFGQPATLVEQYRLLLSYVTYPFLFLALALGSTHIAAEYSHHTMGSWLTFEPRRTLVHASKTLAAALATLPMVTLSLTVVLLGVPVIFRYYGIDDGMSSQDWTSIAWMALRLVVLAMAAAVFGACSAFLVKHSGAVLGIMVGYLVLAEGIVGAMIPAVQKLLLGRNISAFMEQGTTWSSLNCDAYDCEEVTHHLSFTHGTVVLSVLVVGMAILSWLHFRRADVE